MHQPRIHLSEEEDQVMHTSGPAQYVITGDAGGMEAKCFVSMVEYNYLKDYSFDVLKIDMKFLSSFDTNEKAK